MIAFLIATGATVLTIALAHGDIKASLSALISGAFGSPYSIGNTLVQSTPLLLCGLGVAIAFRAQMFNIGGEGQFIIGALSASFVANNIAALHQTISIVLIPIMLVAGAIGGAIWAVIAGLLKTSRNVPEVISTIMLNFVAYQILSYLVNGPMQRLDHSQPATDALNDNATLPNIWHGTSLDAGVLIALVATVVVWALISRTVFGFSIDVVGANPKAAKLAGWNVNRTILLTMAWSGALCGLAGAVVLSGTIGFLPEGYAPGYGFKAIAVALIGRLNPGGIVLAALLFGALEAGSGNMERTAGIAHELGFVIQAVALLVLLASQWDGWSRIAFRRKVGLRQAG